MSKEILSTVTGTVWKIEVQVGDEIEEDEDFIILESMKMEMPIAAEADCIVKELRCAEGDAVEEGQVLLVVEES